MVDESDRELRDTTDDEVTAPPEVDERLRVAYDEGRRQMDLQSHAMDELRARSTSLVPVAGVAVAFFIGIALRNDAPMRAPTWVALVSFAGLVVATVVIQWPRYFTFGNDSKIIVEQWIDVRKLDINDTYRHLANYYSENYAVNERALKWMHRTHILAVGALGVSIIAAVLDVAWRR